MTTVEDFWGAEEFEDTVAAAIIAGFESRPLKNKGAAPSDRLTEERLQAVRNQGVYVPGSSRLVLLPDSGPVYFDLTNDILPEEGCYAWKPGHDPSYGYYGYIHMLHVRKAKSLGKYWSRRAGGPIYESVLLSAVNNGVEGERSFFTVAKDGEIVTCAYRVPSYKEYGRTSLGITLEASETFYEERSRVASVALQFLADRRFCWSITAQEKQVKAHLGCMREEVKSLLYARSLPMTETGRKRPILHLVESHKRRIRSGIDVDITSFLRGQQVVEIGGTVFRVNAPAVLRPELSKNSQQNYFKE